MLDPRSEIHDVTEHIVLFHEPVAVMEAYANTDLFAFLAPLTIFGKSALHADSCLYCIYFIVELREDTVTHGFDNAATFTFDHRKNDAVVTIDHVQHVWNIALFVGVCGRAYDIAEQNRHRLEHLRDF